MRHLSIILAAAACLAGLCHTATAYAQKARPADISFMKGKQAGLIANYDFSPTIVKAALIDRFEKGGLDHRSTTKGFISYQGATWTEIDTASMNIYALVEGQDDKSTVSLLVTKGTGNFISAANDAATTNRLKIFLDGLRFDIVAYNLVLAIDQQEEAVRQATRDVTHETKSGEDFARELALLQQRIDAADQSRKKLEVTLEEQKAKLAGLKANTPNP